MRLQLSMLLVPTAVRTNFWARKLTSLVAFEQENIPKLSGPCVATACPKPAAAASSASSQPAGRSDSVLSDERLGQTGQPLCRSTGHRWAPFGQALALRGHVRIEIGSLLRPCRAGPESGDPTRVQ